MSAACPRSGVTMGSGRSSLLGAEEVWEIGEQTGFTRPRVERLHGRFSSLDMAWDILPGRISFGEVIH